MIFTEEPSSHSVPLNYADFKPLSPQPTVCCYCCCCCGLYSITRKTRSTSHWGRGNTYLDDNSARSFVHRHQLQQTGEEKARQAARQLKEEQLRREDAEKRLQNAHRTEESLRKEVGTVYTALDSKTAFALTLTLPGRSAGLSGSLNSYCSLKPLCSGMGEAVPARTLPTLLPPSPRTVLSLSFSKCCSASIVVTSTVRVN